MVIFFLLLLGLPAYFLEGWLIQHCVTWFIAPIYPIGLSLIQAMGLSLLMSVLCHQVQIKPTHLSDQEYVANVLVQQYTALVIWWGTALLLHAFQ